DVARPGPDHDGQCVRDRVVDSQELEVERTQLVRVVLLDDPRDRPDAVLLELRLDEGERERRAQDRDVAAVAQQVRDGTDVVLVAMGEDEAHDPVVAPLEVGEVGQDQVDARLRRLREEDAAVDDEDLAAVLEDGHVAADLAEAAEGDDPQGFGGRLARFAGLRLECQHVRYSLLRRARRTASTCCASAGSRGRRVVREGITPRSSSAAFAATSPGMRFMIASTRGTRSAAIRRAAATSFDATRETRVLRRSAATCPTTETMPTAPSASRGKLSASAPE